MRVFLLSLLVFVSLSIVFSGCRGRQQSPRIPVSCSGVPSNDDYLITTRGDLLINGDKCKFKFPLNRKVKNKKSLSKDRSWNCRSKITSKQSPASVLWIESQDISDTIQLSQLRFMLNLIRSKQKIAVKQSQNDTVLDVEDKILIFLPVILV